MIYVDANFTCKTKTNTWPFTYKISSRYANFTSYLGHFYFQVDRKQLLLYNSTSIKCWPLPLWAPDDRLGCIGEWSGVVVPWFPFWVYHPFDEAVRPGLTAERWCVQSWMLSGQLDSTQARLRWNKFTSGRSNLSPSLAFVPQP